MFLNIAGNEAKSSITPQPQGNFIQPNAVDIDIQKVYKISNTLFTLDANNTKTHRLRDEMAPSSDGFWFLAPGVYEFVSGFEIEIDKSECGWIITRSTLVRNGCFATSGLYDSGYHGVVGGVLHVSGGPVKIQRGSRIAQFILTQAETLNMYNGSYGRGKDNY